MTYNSKKPNILYDPANNEGFLNHYHHFLFGYLLPVYIDVKEKKLDKTHNIFLLNVKSKSMNSKTTDLGFNVWGNPKVHWNTPLIRSTAKGFDGTNHPIDKKITGVINRYLIKRNKSVSQKPYILLLDRGKKVTAHRKQFEHTFGSERRTIVNIATVERILSEYADVRRVDPQNFTLHRQIELFKNAWMIVSQHGAGLSNTIFTSKCKFMVEIVNDKKPEQYDWFQSVSEAKGIARYRIHTRDNHCVCNTDEIRRIMEYLKSNNYIPTPITES